jgi:hypothetical protein
MTTKL